MPELSVSVRIGNNELIANGSASDVKEVYNFFIAKRAEFESKVASGEDDLSDPLIQALGLADPRPVNGPPLTDWGAEDDE